MAMALTALVLTVVVEVMVVTFLPSNVHCRALPGTPAMHTVKMVEIPPHIRNTRNNTAHNIYHTTTSPGWGTSEMASPVSGSLVWGTPVSGPLVSGPSEMGPLVSGPPVSGLYKMGLLVSGSPISAPLVSGSPEMALSVWAPPVSGPQNMGFRVSGLLVSGLFVSGSQAPKPKYDAAKPKDEAHR